MSKADGAPAARLRAALAAAALPEQVRRAWLERPPIPAAGQIWRARWGALTQVLVILDASARSVRVAPVTVDPAGADDSAAIVPPGGSDLGVALVVWLGDATSVPVRVLDRHLGAVEIDLRDAAGLQYGRPVLTAADDRGVHRARLQDTLDSFVTARWAPDGNGSLPDLLGPIDPQRLIDALGGDQRSVIALRRGRAPITPEQAARIAPLTGQTVPALLSANPRLPEGLAADLDLPANRANVTSLALRRGIAETEAWLTAGYSVFAAAHRQTEGEAPSWQARLDRYFAAALDEQ